LPGKKNILPVLKKAKILIKLSFCVLKTYLLLNTGVTHSLLTNNQNTPLIGTYAKKFIFNNIHFFAYNLALYLIELPKD
jgi:hypothetical protein